jgi:hypothetical protein
LKKFPKHRGQENQMKLNQKSFALLLVAFLGCKKYPENNLWLKKPEKLLPFFDTHLTKYRVNGVDSLDLLNSYFQDRQGLVKDIRKALFKTERYSSYNRNSIIFESSMSIPFLFEFTSKKKKIRFDLSSDPTIFNKNIFIDKNTEWTILRLARTGPFKIETKLENGNHYEIEIE